MVVKILAFLQDFPLPPNNGIRADISRRLRCFHAMGLEVHAVTWTGGRMDPFLSDEDLSVVHSLTETLHVEVIDRTWQRALRLLRYPSQIAGRILNKGQINRILASAQASGGLPDFIWIDGIHASGAALQIARLTNIPVVYRSHNREARFLAEQARLSSGLHRLSILASNFGLSRWELALLRQAILIADISIEDRNHWRSQGIIRNIWLPPLASEDILATSSMPESNRDIDLLYVGGLISPNNIVGLTWFVEKVMPILNDSTLKLRIVVAGRSPSALLRATLEGAGIEVFANPERVEDLFARARVVFNPIFHGSGINLKTIDMIASGRPVVTTTKGARGLPNDLLQMVTVADDPTIFAQNLCRHFLSGLNNDEQIARSEILGRRLGKRAVETCIEAIQAQLSGTSCLKPFDVT